MKICPEGQRRYEDDKRGSDMEVREELKGNHMRPNIPRSPKHHFTIRRICFYMKKKKEVYKITSYSSPSDKDNPINPKRVEQPQKDQPCCSSSSSQFYPKVAPKLTVPTLVVLNSQESDSLNYASKDETYKGKGVCLSDDLNVSQKDCVDYEDEDAYEDDDDVLNKLEILRLSGQEADLSNDVFKANDQLQQDEILAMESIYGDNIFILDNKNGLRSFQIHIHIEAPEELTISTKLNTHTNNSEDFSYSFQVKYIPPIILTCLLPKSYPTHLPPYFTIYVQWLDSVKISSLCSMLDSIWNEQHGQEVIYSWVEWLHSYAISYLGFDKEIILGPYGSEFIRLPCQHFFCEKCMKTYADVLIQEGSVNKLLCPITKCGGMIPPYLIKRWLGDEEFEKWESLTLQKTLESMADVVYCPRCETPCIEDKDQHAQCSKCFFNFCTLCREKRHVGIMCMEPEMKLRILQERQESGKIGEKQRKHEQGMIQELLSIETILRDAKLCPSCKMAISRIDGCNKMVCRNCGNYFCYRCNYAINGYDHFRTGSCDLFPQQAIIRNREERMNPRQLVRQVQAQAAQLVYGQHGPKCPRCGQNNVKIGNNNHIFCWACQGHYCYLCRKIVRRGSQHFGLKGCKQHTVG
ncbi:NDR1/HIN1-like 8 [Artemisia annua]|uniref:RBR-type E3 ubiquitin transferase n=1 Tax=Artemisia annua TaxID=35608 RepID=A0A2U1QD74_ARTAN|nr:NDR1/HIN1-like 8 [Artemisia annua]